MSQKSKTHRENTSLLGSESSFRKNRTKSVLNIAVSSTTTNQTEKNLQRLTNAETRNSNLKNATRNLHFSFGSAKESVKKNYKKNSDKTIKPPEKSQKLSKHTSALAKQETTLSREHTTTLLARTNTSLNKSNHAHGAGTASKAKLICSKRSLTYDNIKPKSSTTPPYARVDIKAIEELARRLEHLQTIFMSKLELFHSREPNSKKKAYKLVAMIVGDEAKLLVKETDAQRLPNYIPARSVEDLNSKINKFFSACLTAFTDQLRAHQRDNQDINCDEICKELKRDEQVFCAILKDWVFEMCDEADTTLVPSLTKDVREFGTQSDFINCDPSDISDKNFVDFANLRAELSELKLQLSQKDESHMEEITKLKEQFETKYNALSKSMLVEKTIAAAKDEKIYKVQELNDSLSQQLKETNELVENLTKHNEELNAKLQNETDLAFELKKVREEFQSIHQANNDLNEMKLNFLRKLNARATRIDLLEKEIKQQKRKMDTQNKEIEDLKLEFEAKVKENCEYKESLEARNQLIDHLRKAVEIEQRKRKESEEKSLKMSTELSAGIKLMDKTPYHKHADAWKYSFNEYRTTMNFTETMPAHIKGSLAMAKEVPKRKANNNKCTLDLHSNRIDLKEHKSITEDSSCDESTAVRDHYHQRKVQTILVKKH